jgi:uncharacterized membrane protein YfcA
MLHNFYMTDTEKENSDFIVLLKIHNPRLLIISESDTVYKLIDNVINSWSNIKITLISNYLSESLVEDQSKYIRINCIDNKYENINFSDFDLVITLDLDEETSKKLMKIAHENNIYYQDVIRVELSDFALNTLVNSIDLHKSTIYTNDYGNIETTEVLENLQIENQSKSITNRTVITSNAIIIQRVKKTIAYSFLIIFFMIVGHILFSYVQNFNIKDLVFDIRKNLDDNFVWYLLAGFVAQMIDGSLGMAYGVSVTTFLQSLGLPAITPAVASASMHASEIFTTGSSSLVYMRFKNINMKLFKILVWPGIMGAIIGAILVSYISKEYVAFIKPLVAIYTLILGILILRRALKKSMITSKIKNIFPVAFSGGFLDSIGGGGWGPIVTSSLLAGGRNMRYAVGSAHLAKMFVAIVSTITFFITIGIGHWQIIFGLVIGGMIAAPFSIYLSNKIPIKKGLILVAILIIVLSLRTIIQSFLK